VKAIPVILVTVLEEKLRGLRLGASEYLTKPLNMDALLGAIQRCRQSGNHPPDIDSKNELSHV
jgi:DNA-binding response OmpR family regulator